MVHKGREVPVECGVLYQAQHELHKYQFIQVLVLSAAKKGISSGADKLKFDSKTNKKSSNVYAWMHLNSCTHDTKYPNKSTPQTAASLRLQKMLRFAKTNICSPHFRKSFEYIVQVCNHSRASKKCFIGKIKCAY